MVEVVAAERGITAGRQHFKHAATQAQNRDIEGAAAEVVNRDNAFFAGVQTVGDRRRRRFIEQTQDVQPRQTRRVFRSLALCIVKVSGHGNDHTIQLARQRFRRPRRQRFQDIGRNTYRVEQTCRRFNHRQTIFTGLELIRQMGIARLNIRQRAAHHAFYRADGVSRVLRRVRARRVTDRVALLLIVND